MIAAHPLHKEAGVKKRLVMFGAAGMLALAGAGAAVSANANEPDTLAARTAWVRRSRS